MQIDRYYRRFSSHAGAGVVYLGSHGHAFKKTVSNNYFSHENEIKNENDIRK